MHTNKTQCSSKNCVIVFFFFLEVICFLLIFSDRFDILMLKINFKNKKNIILIYFSREKQPLSQYQTDS